jgi:hypothetical protein
MYLHNRAWINSQNAGRNYYWYTTFIRYNKTGVSDNSHIHFDVWFILLITSFYSLDYLRSLELASFDRKDNYCVVSVTYISDTVFSASTGSLCLLSTNPSLLGSCSIWRNKRKSHSCQKASPILNAPKTRPIWRRNLERNILCFESLLFVGDYFLICFTVCIQLHRFVHLGILMWVRNL